MPAMPLLVKLALVAIVALLVGLIVLYHIWVDRRMTSSPATRPVRVAPIAAGSLSADGEAPAGPRQRPARHGARKR